MPRSACVHPDHQATVVSALQRNGYLTQGDLAANLMLNLSTVSRFFRGIGVSISNFEQICESLALEPREIMLSAADATALSQPDSDKSSVSAAPNTTVQFFAYDPFWVGRESLVKTLSAKLNDACRLMLITGIAGVGKTALSERLSTELQTNLNPQHIVRVNFDNQEQATDFASVAARLLESCDQPVSPEEHANTQLLTRRLIAYLQGTPTLVLIDSLEVILHGNTQTGWSEFKDEAFVTCFQSVLASSTFASRFILTSQELPAQILQVGSRYQNFWHRQPITGLSESEQASLFEKTGFTLESELIRIGKAYEGHPLALRTILGEIGAHPFYGNVAAYWQSYGQEIEAVEKSIAEAAAGNISGADDSEKWKIERFTRALQLNVQQRLEHTFARLRQETKYAYILLCEASVYRCPVADDWWLSHLEDWEQNEEAQIAALDVLRDRYLIEEKIEGTERLLRQHNLIRSVALAHLKALTFDL